MTTRSNEPLRDALRRETRAHHEALESTTAVARADADHAAYRDHLVWWLGYLAPLEERLHATPGLAERVPDLEQRRKVALLERDLGVTARDVRRCEHVPECRSVARGLGVLYVLEGATLGGRLLLERLRASGVVPGPLGTSYLDPYGARQGEAWRELLGRLEETPRAEHADVVGAAVETFETMIAWKEAWTRADRSRANSG